MFSGGFFNWLPKNLKMLSHNGLNLKMLSHKGLRPQMVAEVPELLFGAL